MDQIAEKLELRRQTNSLRTLQNPLSFIDFYSNDYLGLAANGELQKEINNSYYLIDNKNQLNGSTGSRLLSGNSSLIEETEKELSDFFLSESALIFNSGYTANLGILSSVPQKGDTILLDESVHASLKDGARLSHAKRFSFRHNNLSDLENKIKRSEGNIFIVIESIYSMGGDFSPLEEIVLLSEKYSANIILDEAHTTGIIGEKGNGLACLLNLQNRIFARIHTFGKAMGIHGACIAGSKNLINYLINFSRPFIYTTAMSPHAVCSITSAFKYLEKNLHLIQQLNAKIDLFDKITKAYGIGDSYRPSFFRSPIKVVLASGNDVAKELSNKLLAEGFNVKPILSPTVKKGNEMVRICLHLYNSDEEIKNLTVMVNNLRINKY